MGGPTRWQLVKTHETLPVLLAIPLVVNLIVLAVWSVRIERRNYRAERDINTDEPDIPDEPDI